MASIFCCGFECGLLGTVGQHWRNDGTTASIGTSTVRSGARSLRVNPTGAAGYAYMQTGIMSGNVGVVRFYVNVASIGAADTFIGGIDVNGTMAGLGYKTSDGLYYPATKVLGGSISFGSGGVSLSAGWHCIDVRVNATSNPWVIDVRVDGTSLTTFSPGLAAAAVRWAWLGQDAARTMDVFYDDVIVSITSGDYPFGPGKVEHFVPVSDGAHNIAGLNDFERSLTGTDILNSTTDAYTLISKVPLPSSVTDFINMVAPVNATDGTRHDIGPAPGISTPTTGPRGVESIIAIHQAGTGAGNMRVRIFGTISGLDVYSAVAVAGSTTLQYKRAHFATGPGAGAWNYGAGGNNDFSLIDVIFDSGSAVDANPDQYLDAFMIEAEFVEETNINAQPGVGALTVDGFAPTATASDHQNVTPDVGALVVTGLEPTALVDTSVAPDVGALTVTGFEPTVTATEHQNIEVPAGALVITGIEPTVTATANQFVEPDAGAAVITGLEPNVTASDHVTAEPGVGALVVTGLEPTADITANQFAEPGVGDLQATGFEPTVSATENQNVTPGVGDLVVTGFEPTVAATDHQVVEPGVGDLIVTGLEPTADISADQNVQPGTGELLATGLEPTVVASDHQNVQPDVGALTVDGFAPNVAASDNQNAAPSTGDLVITGLEPSLLIDTNLTPGAAALVVTGLEPTVSVTNHQMVVTETGELIITGLEPSISTGGTDVEPGAGALIVTGFAPDVEGGSPAEVNPGFGVLRVDGFAPLIFVGPAGDLSVTPGSRERLRAFFRRRQLTNETGNVVVQCNPDGTATYVPGTVDQTWEEFTNLVAGLDKLDLSWDKTNSNTSGETTDTNPGGSNYDKGISATVTVNDEAFQFIYDWLLSDPCGILNAVEVMITDDLCKKQYRTFEIKADNLNYAPYAAPCEFEVKLREADPVWHCVHKTFIWDNWQEWFLDGSAKNHPCFLTAVESRPRLLASARMGLSIFGRTIPVFSAIFNENDDAFRRIQNVDNFVDAPLIRDIITNVCDKCGLSIDTMFHDPANPYYDLCLFYPGSGAMHTSDSSAVTSPSLSFHFENRWNITLAELLDKLKAVFKAEWYVTPNNTLVFQPMGDFLALANTPIFDFTHPDNADTWDKYSLQYTFNGNKKPAYGRYQYTIDASDLATQEAQPLYNDIVDYDGPANNLMLEGNVSRVLEFASTGAVRDGRAKRDYLRETVSEGETVAYALVVLMAVVIAALFAGTVTIGAAIALTAFLGIWTALIASKANSLRTLFGSTTYSGAVRLTSEQVATPRLVLWDGESFNRAKMVSVATGSILPNTFYNPDSEPYTTRNKFQYGPTAVYNYPMYFESYFLGNLYDRFHDELDNPLKSMDTHQAFDMDAYMCCELLDVLGVWENEFAKIGYFVKLERRDGYDVLGRIEHFDVNYDDEKIHLRGQVYKVKT